MMSSIKSSLFTGPRGENVAIEPEPINKETVLNVLKHGLIKKFNHRKELLEMRLEEENSPENIRKRAYQKLYGSQRYDKERKFKPKKKSPIMAMSPQTYIKNGQVRSTIFNTKNLL